MTYRFSYTSGDKQSGTWCPLTGWSAYRDLDTALAIDRFRSKEPHQTTIGLGEVAAEATVTTVPELGAMRSHLPEEVVHLPDFEPQSGPE